MSDTITLNVYAESGLVMLEADTDDGGLALPLDPDVAEALAVRLMIAVEKARGGRNGN